MKLKTDMTPGFVGTALAAVAAGSLVLFSLVLQQSAFDTSFTKGLEAISPSESELGIKVAAAPEANDSAGDRPGTETSPFEDTTGPAAPTNEIDTFSPIGDGETIVASTEDPSDDIEFPGASGGIGNRVNDGGLGETIEADGPQATINKDPNGRPDDITLPDRNGPKNASPPHGSESRPDDDHDSDDRADGGRAKKDKSEGKSADDKRSAKPSKPGRDNGGGSDSKRDNRSSSGDKEDRKSEDRNDRHDTRKDPDDNDDGDYDDDDDRDDDSRHSNDDSRSQSRTNGSKH